MISALRTDSHLSVNKVPMRLKDINMSNGQLTLLDDTGRTHILSGAEFARGYKDRSIKLEVDPRDIDAHEPTTRRGLRKLYDEVEITRVERIEGYVKSILDEHGGKIASCSERVKCLKRHAILIGDKRAMSDRNATRCYARWNACGRTIDSLISNRSRCGNRTPRLSELKESLIDEIIQNEYLVKARPTAQAIVKLINDRIKEDAIYVDEEPVSRSAVVRRIKAIPIYTRCVLREGWFAAQRKFPHGSAVVKPTYINTEIELDHTPMDVETICPNTGETIGRVWLTLTVDRATRMVTGYYLSHHEPSAFSVVETVKNAAIQKDDILERYEELRGYEWPCWGLFSTLIVDNGPDLHSKKVFRALINLGITTHFNPKGNARMKGTVERTLGVGNNEITELMPGRTFANYIQKGDYKSAKNAVLTLADLEKALVIWIVKEFHTRKDRFTKTSRLEDWKKLATQHPEIRLPPNVEDFDKLYWKADTRKLGYKGIQINNRFYQSVELQEIAKIVGHKTTLAIYIDEMDVGIIRVRVPDSEDLIDVYVVDCEYRRLGLSLKDHEEVVALALKRNPSVTVGHQLGEAQLLSAWNDILRIRDEAISSKKIKERKAEAKRRAKRLGNTTKKDEPSQRGVLRYDSTEVPIIPNMEDL